MIEIDQQFLTNTDHTGRQIVYSHRTGKKYYIEPIGDTKTGWGDVNPSTGKVEGNYGKKYRGSIDKANSLITELNGFKNISELPPGFSPYAEIQKRDRQYPSLTK